MSDAEPMYLSRARLRHDAPITELRKLLGTAGGTSLSAGHNLVWTLFGDRVDRRRDFLWREAESGLFYLLSDRIPTDTRGLFRLDPPRTFSPQLVEGDQLGFVLRVNATISRKPFSVAGTNTRLRGVRHDIVMDALKPLPTGERAGPRKELAPRLAADWLGRQGETRGFSLAEQGPAEAWEAVNEEAGAPSLRVTNYRILRVGRGVQRQPMEVGVLDLEGTLVVHDPGQFIAALRHGFGRAKAFGCGLMLIRRAR